MSKILLWAMILVSVFALSLIGLDVALAVVLLLALGILVLSEVYSRFKTDREYSRDTYKSLLIGRCSMGIDQKGRETKKIIK